MCFAAPITLQVHGCILDNDFQTHHEWNYSFSPQGKTTSYDIT